MFTIICPFLTIFFLPRDLLEPPIIWYLGVPLDSTPLMGIWDAHLSNGHIRVREKNQSLKKTRKTAPTMAPLILAAVFDGLSQATFWTEHLKYKTNNNDYNNIIYPLLAILSENNLGDYKLQTINFQAKTCYCLRSFSNFTFIRLCWQILQLKTIA